MKQVAIFTYNNAALFELGCAVELFALPRPEFDTWYKTDVVTFKQHPLMVTGGIKLQTKIINDFNNYDMLVIPSWPSEQSSVPHTIANKIKYFHQSGGRIISFCSGAFLLAELGLLDGKNATTHWRYAEKFKNRYQSITYIEDVLYIYDGQIGCSAGSTAAIDLGIEIIRKDYGYQVANQVARRLVISAHRDGGQSQFVETPIIKKPSQFSSALDWALTNLTSDINVNTLAKKANMSRRTFDRKFRTSLNLTPKEWLTMQRLHLAKQLLEDTSYSIERIANMSGFDNAITLRHNFRKILSLSPRRYREQFGKK